MEVITFAKELSSVGFATLLVLIIIGSYKGIWVWGRQLTKAEGEIQEWKAMALKGVRMAETSVNLATQVRG